MKKNIYVLIGLFAVLLIIAFLVLQKPGEQSTSSSSIGLLFEIDSVSVDKIEVKSPSTSLAVEKRGTEWFITQPITYKANQGNICQIIHQIKNLEMKNTVSNKPEKYTIFNVDQTGTQITVYEKGTEKASFILGKMGTSYTESYSRKLNSDDVVLVEGAYSYSFNRPVKDWRDRSIFSMPRESIKEVQYQYGDTVFSLAFRDSIWFIGREKARRTAVDGILSALSNLQADDFVDSALSPKITALIKVADLQLRFSFNKKINKYYVQTSNSPQWFVLEQWKANQILKRKREIAETSAK
jgi:hypothetical protein